MTQQNQRDSDPCTLFVNYVPTIVGNEELAQIFSPFGKITLARVIYDRASGEHRGFGFVRYAGAFSAAMARQCLCGLEIHGKRLKVDFARASQPFAVDPWTSRLAPLRVPPTSVCSYAPPWNHPAYVQVAPPGFWLVPQQHALVPLPPSFLPMPAPETPPSPLQATRLTEAALRALAAAVPRSAPTPPPEETPRPRLTEAASALRALAPTPPSLDSLSRLHSDDNASVPLSARSTATIAKALPQAIQSPDLARLPSW